MQNGSTGTYLAEVGKLAVAMADEALAPMSLSAKQWRALVTIKSGAISQRELTGSTGIDRTTMVSVLDELEDRGLVQRTRAAEDRRRYVLTLTASGRSTLQKAQRAIVKRETELLEPLSKAERDTLHELVSRVMDHAKAEGRRADVEGPGC